MAHKIGIRREDKNRWERRVPLTPKDAAKLIDKHSLSIAIQPSSIRVYSEEDYRRSGAAVSEDLADCGVVLAVKEIPKDFFLKGKVYVFFSHTIKGQPQNMEMLLRLMERKCHLIDYERIVDAKNRRLIFFGRHAGLAGMIDTLWAVGRCFEAKGWNPNPFRLVEQTYRYKSLDDAKSSIRESARLLEKEGLPADLHPFVVGLAGYGNVSLGAQEILDLYPVVNLEPEELESFLQRNEGRANTIYKVVFREQHMAAPRSKEGRFRLQEYYDRPERYEGVFEKFLPHLTVLMNCIYWDTPYPRLVTKESIRKLYASSDAPRLKWVGDISCDIEGAVEFTAEATEPDNPVYVYEPKRDRIVYGVEGEGPLVMAVDNLPCELSLEASQDFSRALAPFMAAVAEADYTVPFDQVELPQEIKRAMILHNGAFTPEYKFMEEFIR